MALETKKKNLVVIEDSSDVTDLITAFFKPKGFQVTGFTDVKLAIDELVKNGIDWDVILTDFHFSTNLANELISELKKTHPRLPIISISSEISSDSSPELPQKENFDTNLKSIDFASLQKRVGLALNMKSDVSNVVDRNSREKDLGLMQSNIVGRSPNFLKALHVAKRVAGSSAHIFLTGETGSGKEVFAKYIHSESRKRKGPFVAINCSAIPENLLESELFGHAKGSFTGAQEKRIGLFEEAQDGTLFLDEIGDLTLSLQAKLLRVLEDKRIKRVGENQYRPINCRIVSATHKDLPKEVSEHRFREDLYYRLDVISIVIPPLRDRKDDILPLAELFLKRFSLNNDSIAKSFSKEAEQFMLENVWRGNVRELENSIERAVILSNTSEISLAEISPTTPQLRSRVEDANRYSNGNGNENRKDNGKSNSDGAINGISNLNSHSPQNTFTIQYTDKLPLLNDVINKYIEYAVARKGGARDKTALEIGIDRKTLYKHLKSDITTHISMPRA
jgi:DNA-binding NtrC family response regulator